MERYRSKGTTILSDDTVKDTQYEDAVFLEVHLDERFYVGEGLQLFYTSVPKDNQVYIDAAKRLFYDPDKCIDFISSFPWRKIFLTLNDTFSFMLPLIHDLPQIVYIYIYSVSPDTSEFESNKYPKWRGIVLEDSPNADEKLLADIELFKRDLLRVNVTNAVIRETILLTKDTSEEKEHSAIQIQDDEDNDLSVVWLQDDNDKNSIDMFSLKSRIESLKIYVNIEECIDYIQSLNDGVQIFFISSKLNDNIFLRRIINLSKIRFIYILYMEENQSIILNESSNKIRGIYLSTKNLCDQLLKDYSRALKMAISIFNKDEHEKTLRNLQKDNTRFLWFQLLVDILIKIPHNNQTIEEMFHECKNFQKGDKSTAKAIEELRKNYKPTNALRHYTADTFLYKRFNRALRTENIDFLFVFRLFLADMYNQLRQLYIEQFVNDTIKINNRLELYRGQQMTVNEFNIIKENVGHLISINSFFSTTKSYTIASAFAGYGVEAQESNIISVVFQIDVEDTGHSLKRPFASLQKISKVEDEDEVLFSVGTIFRVEDVITIPGTTKDWYVTLTLVNDDDDNEIIELRKELEREFCDNCDLSNLGSVLIKMGDYDKAERYFQIILEHVSNNEQTIPLVYTYLGIIHCNKGDHNKALEYHHQALKNYTERNELYYHQDDIGVTYTHIGSNYHQLGNNQLALEYFNKATQIQISPRRNAYTFNQIAIIHRDYGDYNQALEYFQKSLEIDENVLQLNKYHPSLATAYNNIGEIYHKLGNYENALKTLEHALVICLKGTVSTHTDLAAIYNNLGCVYDKTKCPEKALEMFEKALEIDTKVLPENHSSLAVSHNNIAALYREKDELTKALYHQEKSLRILLKSDVKDNAAQLSLCQHNLGCIHLSLGNHTKALNMLEKALKTQMECLPEYHENFSNTYLSLSRAYEKQENIPQALEYLEKAVENARRSLLPHNQSKFLVFQEHLDLFKLVHFSEDKPNQKTIYMQAELLDNTNVQAQFATSSNNVSERIRSLSNCGTMHSRKTEYDMAMKCFDDAITLYNQRQFLALTDEQELEELMTLLYFNLARLYYRQQNLAVAFQVLEKSLDLASKQDQQKTMLAEIYNFAGIMYSYKGDFSRAEHYFNLAIDVAKKNLPSDHPDLQRYYLQLKQLKYMMQHV